MQLHLGDSFSIFHFKSVPLQLVHQIVQALIVFILVHDGLLKLSVLCPESLHLLCLLAERVLHGINHHTLAQVLLSQLDQRCAFTFINSSFFLVRDQEL